MSSRPAPSSAVQPSRRPSVQSRGSKTLDDWTDSPDGRDDLELVAVLPAPYGLAAKLYRRRQSVPVPQDDEWAPWEQPPLDGPPAETNHAHPSRPADRTDAA